MEINKGKLKNDDMKEMNDRKKKSDLKFIKYPVTHLE